MRFAVSESKARLNHRVPLVSPTQKKGSTPLYPLWDRGLQYTFFSCFPSLSSRSQRRSPVVLLPWECVLVAWASALVRWTLVTLWYPPPSR